MVTSIEEQQNADHPLKKILLLHDHVKVKCFDFYQPLQEVSVDERMVRSKARTKFRQYMKDKPTKWGFKYWVLSDPSGYTVDFDLYCGASRNTSRSEFGLGYDVVMSLVSPLLYQNYRLYCDNFYSSPVLFHSLLQQGITATGTLKVDRRGVPSDVAIMKNALKPRSVARGTGYYIREQNSQIAYCCWQDNKVVCVMSTCHPGHSISTVRRKVKNPSDGTCQVQQVATPIMIENYNKFMGSVDKSDQLLSYHNTLRRTVCYWKMLFYHMLDIAVINSLVIYNWVAMEQDRKPINESDYRDALILQIIAKYRAPRTTIATPASTATSIVLPQIPSPHKCRIQHGY